MIQHQVEKHEPTEYGRADVYVHTRRNQLSIKDREASSETYGQVIGHEDAVRIHQPDVVVYEGQRLKAVRTGRKNVHALLRGHVETVDEAYEAGYRVQYDVEHEGCFHLIDGRTVVGADLAHVGADGSLWMINPETA